MQRPHTRPAPRPVPHPIGGQPLDPGPLPPPQHLRGNPQQLQCRVGALHGAHRESSVGGQPCIGWPAVASGRELRIERACGGNRQHRRPTDLVGTQHRAHPCLVAQVVGDWHRVSNPPISTTGPARHPRPRIGLEVQDDRRQRDSAAALAHQHNPRPGPRDTAPAHRRAAPAVTAGHRCQLRRVVLRMITICVHTERHR